MIILNLSIPMPITSDQTTQLAQALISFYRERAGIKEDEQPNLPDEGK